MQAFWFGLLALWYRLRLDFILQSLHLSRCFIGILVLKALRLHINLNLGLWRVGINLFHLFFKYLIFKTNVLSFVVVLDLIWFLILFDNCDPVFVLENIWYILNLRHGRIEVIILIFIIWLLRNILDFLIKLFISYLELIFLLFSLSINDSPLCHIDAHPALIPSLHPRLLVDGRRSALINLLSELRHLLSILLL